MQQIKNLLSNNILKSSAGLLTITILVKVFGYVEKLVLANYFGTSYQVDVYTVVLTFVLSIFFFFREIVEPGFLNVFLESKSKGNETISWNLFNKGLRLILLVTSGISMISLFFPNVFTTIFAPGFNGKKLELSNKLVRIAVLACIFLALSTLTSITLNGLKKFVLPASGELVFKGFIIACMVLFYKNYGIAGAVIGIVVGSAGRLSVHLTRLYKRISFKKIIIEDRQKRRIWQLTWPLLIGVSFSQLSGLIDNIFASYLQEGAIASLSYAKKIVELPVIVFPYVVSIVVFPYFTLLAVEKESDKLKALLAGSLKWIIIAFLPIAAFFLVYSVPIVEIIFQRGAFDSNSTLLTAKPLMVYSLGMVFFAIETILVIFYYANADTKTPVFIGIGCVLLNIVLTWFFIRFMGYTGIALAYVIQKTVKNLVLLYRVKRKVSCNLKNLWAFLLKLTVSFFAFVMLIVIVKTTLYNGFNQSLIGKMAFIVSAFIISGVIYMFILHALNVIQIRNKK